MSTIPMCFPLRRYAHFLASLTLLISALALPLLAPKVVFAEDEHEEVNIEQIRKELAQMKLGAPSTETKPSVPSAPIAATSDKRAAFTVVERDLEVQKKELLSAEAALLKELQQTAAVVPSAPVKPVKNLNETPASAVRAPLNLDAIHRRAVEKGKLAEASAESAPRAMAVIPSKLETHEDEGSQTGAAPAPVPESAISQKDEDFVEAFAAIKNAPPSTGVEKDISSEAASDEALRQISSAGSELNEPARVGSLARVEAVSAGAGRIAVPRTAGVSIDTRELNSLKVRLSSTERKNQQLSRDLEEARSRLMIAETEVERLASLLEKRGQSGAIRTGTTSGERALSLDAPAVTRVAHPRAERSSADTTILTVMVDKANLRAGPRMDDSPLMSVSKGTRLTVEMRQGEWYRVIAPTGARAWIASDVVAFGKDGMSSPTRTIRVKGFDSDLENEGFASTRKASVQ